MKKVDINKDLQALYLYTHSKYPNFTMEECASIVHDACLEQENMDIALIRRIILYKASSYYTYLNAQKRKVNIVEIDDKIPAHFLTDKCLVFDSDISKYLETLTQEEQEILNDYYVKEKPFRQIAETKGIHLFRVMKLHDKAILKLRVLMERKPYTLGYAQCKSSRLSGDSQ